VYGNALGNDQIMSYPKLEAARKFTNKLWNMARFIEMNEVKSAKLEMQSSMEELYTITKNDTDKEWVKKNERLNKEVTKYIEGYQFNLAAERLYEFIWHEFADIYIEDVKGRIDGPSFLILTSCFLLLL